MKGRFLVAIALAIVSLIGYYGTTSYNEVTGEKQRVSISPQQEIALGLQAAPKMAQQFGGLYPDRSAQERVDRVGEKIVRESKAANTPYKYEFHLLRDDKTLNAFALPGGQIFITAGLLKQLKSEGQLAGVLGHEVAHVVARHSAEQMAKQQLTQGLTGAAVIATYDPENPASRNSAQVAAVIGGLINMKYGRNDELEADRYGVRFMTEAGYDPRGLIGLMKILAQAAQGQRQPEFFSTHPNPENRIAKIQQAIKEEFPNGVPEGLKP